MRTITTLTNKQMFAALCERLALVARLTGIAGIDEQHFDQNNRDCMDYPAYVAAGYFIGSGVIESGNRSVMQERLKLPGMRWDGINAAQGVLALKCKYDSGPWDSLVVPLVYQTYGLKTCKH